MLQYICAWRTVLIDHKLDLALAAELAAVLHPIFHIELLQLDEHRLRTRHGGEELVTFFLLLLDVVFAERVEDGGSSRGVLVVRSCGAVFGCLDALQMQPGRRMLLEDLRDAIDDRLVFCLLGWIPRIAVECYRPALSEE